MTLYTTTEKSKRYLVDTGYACAGVWVEDGIVVYAATIFNWMIGKEWDSVKEWSKIKEIRE